jgi:hypothetical protein
MLNINEIKMCEAISKLSAKEQFALMSKNPSIVKVMMIYIKYYIHSREKQSEEIGVLIKSLKDEGVKIERQATKLVADISDLSKTVLKHADRATQLFGETFDKVSDIVDKYNTELTKNDLLMKELNAKFDKYVLGSTSDAATAAFVKQEAALNNERTLYEFNKQGLQMSNDALTKTLADGKISDIVDKQDALSKQQQKLIDDQALLSKQSLAMYTVLLASQLMI